MWIPLNSRYLRAIEQFCAGKGGAIVPSVGKVDLRLATGAVDDIQKSKLDDLRYHD